MNVEALQALGAQDEVPGIGRTHVSSLEQGRKEVGLEMQFVLSDGLGVTVGAMLDRTERLVRSSATLERFERLSKARILMGGDTCPKCGAVYAVFASSSEKCCAMYMPPVSVSEPRTPKAMGGARVRPSVSSGRSTCARVRPAPTVVMVSSSSRMKLACDGGGAVMIFLSPAPTTSVMRAAGASGAGGVNVTSRSVSLSGCVATAGLVAV